MRVNSTLETQQQTASVDPYVTIEWQHRYAGRTNSAGAAANKLKDDFASFQTWGVQAGWTVKNRTDGTETTVASVDSETQLTVTHDYFDNSEFYTVYSTWSRIDNLSDVARIIDPLDHSQEPYGALATVRLHNEDSAFDAYNLRNKWIRIGWGMLCGESNEVSYPPSLKCIGQDFTSKPEDDEDTYIIHCEGAWNILQRLISSIGCYFNQANLNPLHPEIDDMTGKEMVAWLARMAGLDLGADIGTLDGKITTWKPVLDVPPDQNGLQTMWRLLEIFKCVLVPRTDCLHLKYCQDGDAVDYTYKVPTDAAYHPFISGQSRSLIFKPAKVHVVDDGVNPTYEGWATADIWTPDMGWKPLDNNQVQGMATSDDNCQFIAEAYLYRVQSQAESGWVFVPIMNCLQELYDKVTTTDDRGNTGGTGRVGGIYAHCRPGHPDDRMRYCCEIRLGGLQKTLPSDMQAFVDQLGIGEGGIPGDLLLPWSINPNILRQACQKYDCDVVPDPTHGSYTWQQVKWLSGTVKFADGTTLTIDAGTCDLTAEGYADNPVCLYFIQGNSTLQHTDDWTQAVGKDRDIIAIVQRAELTTAEDKASWDGHTGKLGVLNTRVLVAALILAGHIRAGELVLGGVVTGDLDNVNDGSSYGRVLMTHLDASGIKLIDATLVDGGFTIDKIGEGSTNKYFSGKDLNDLPNGATYGRVLLTSISAGKIVLAQIDDDATYLKYLNTERTKLTGVEGGADVTGTHEAATVAALTGLDLDDLENGALWGRVALTDIQAGHILLAEVIESSTYKKYLATERTKLTGVESGADVTGDHQSATVASLIGLVLGDLADGGSPAYGKVLLTDITAGHILLASVTEDATYKKYLATEKTKLSGVQTGADVTGSHQSATTASLSGHDLDDLPNGTTYVKVRATDISAGHLKLTTSTVVSGEWYNESGVEIDAAHGINIYGADNALTTRATKTGAIQCKVDASGAILAGAGAVILDANGIKIKGEYAKFYDASNNYRGYLKGQTILSSLELYAASRLDLGAGGLIYITPGAGGDLVLNVGTTGVVRCSAGVHKGRLGTVNDYWREVWTTKLYLMATVGTALETNIAKAADIGSDSGPFDEMFADDFVNKTPRLRAIEYLPMLDQIKTRGPHNEIVGGLAFPCTWLKPHNPSKPMHTGISTKAFIELSIGCLAELRAKVEASETRIERLETG